MDYHVLLKNNKLDDLMRMSIESVFDEIKDMSSSYFSTKVTISKLDDKYFVILQLQRQEEVLSSDQFSSEIFEEALLKSKDNLLENMFKEFVLAAS